ncbi:hypothetical protein LHL03_11010 [Pectobacterium carotovorum]|uniref:hypothetical protein n=1 Tax=Pectobacterium carotovorum TaxID=554 RepID=UPI001CFAD72F|nr:hypothetical protein [Pectobacterium carotovorum]UCZ77623.1 hypothetical protein LHL03_11010 [Pectobacterium carotovorum]GKW06413.1 hypothetical protein PEC301889_08960 [Pectobacterium carotovorum subsp. carotovorum]
MAISDDDYNQARAILIRAGSKTASASHEKHTQRAGSPTSHGKSLLQEARDEFRAGDQGLLNLHSDMTQAHYDAIHEAADAMNIENW